MCYSDPILEPLCSYEIIALSLRQTDASTYIFPIIDIGWEYIYGLYGCGNCLQETTMRPTTNVLESVLRNYRLSVVEITKF